MPDLKRIGFLSVIYYMKIILNKILILLLVLFVSGCASQAVKEDVVTRSETKSSDLKTAVIPLKKSNVYSNDTLIDVRAFEYFSNAVLLEGIGELPKAAEQYKQALQIYPNSYVIRFSLAEIYYQLRLYSNVIELLDIIEPEDEHVHWLRAASYLTMRKDDSAKISFEKLVAVDPNNIDGYTYLSNFYRAEKNNDSLLWAYKNMTRLQPNNDRFWLEFGRIQAEKELVEDAKISFGKAIEVSNDENSPLAYLALGDIYRFQKKTDSSKFYYKEAYLRDSSNILVNQELALIYVREDSLLLALEYTKNIVELAPLDRQSIRRLGILYYGLDSLDVSDSIFTELVNSGERNPINHFYLGRIAILQKEYQIAAEEFQILIDLQKYAPDNYLDLAFVYRQLNDTTKEIKTYEVGLTNMGNAKDSLTIQFGLGAAFEQYGMTDSAIAVFEEILIKNPEHDQSLNYLGYLLAENNQDLDYALKLIEKANDLVPENAAYLDSYGWVYYKLSDYNKAVKFLKQATELAQDQVIYDHLGDAYEAKGDNNKAVEWWKKALELDPENQDIKNKIEKF